LLIGRLIPAAAATLGAVLLSLWLTAGRAPDVTERVPSAESGPSQPEVQARPIEETGVLTQGDGVPADWPGAWPRFRGTNFDNISTDGTPLARKWGEGGPTALWAVEMGEGYAGPAVLAGRVYVLDYDQERHADALRCLSLADGKEIWRFSHPVRIKRQHGMSRTVVAVTEKHVVGLGPLCHVTCLNAQSGELRWAKHLPKEFGTQVPRWYAGQCPLIDGDRAIIAPGGKALMIALECETGEAVWQTPNPDGWQMTHSSVMPMELDGRRIYVYCASGGVVGVSAEDGALLWKYPEWRIRTATVASPVPVGDGRIFLSGGYNAGSMMLQLEEEDGKLTVKSLFRLEAKEFGAEQHTPILYEGHLYGVRPNGELVCLGLDGKIVWTSGRQNRFGLGPFLIANGLLYAMNGDGLLTLAEATPEGYKQLDRAKVLDGHESWGPMALVGGRLIVRDLTRMVCLDVRQR